MINLFKDALIREAGLLTLSQTDCDLFIIAQTGAATYSQMYRSGVHGTTIDAARKSLKRLEAGGLITRYLMPGGTNEIYFVLSKTGKERLKEVFGEEVLSRLNIDLERRFPTRPLQIPHRLYTGDLYFCFLSNPCLDHVPLWNIEHIYYETDEGCPAPRCDAMLQTRRRSYYIEQDTGSQSAQVISKKIGQYMDSAHFIAEGMLNEVLVFTLHCETAEKTCKTSPQYIYRILLKAQKVWKSMEAEDGTVYNFQSFCAQFKGGTSPFLSFLTRQDRIILQRLAQEHPFLGLGEFILLAGIYRQDNTQKQERMQKQDSLFARRLQRVFYPLPEEEGSEMLLAKLRCGLQLFVLPNHRLNDHIPFALQEDYRFSSFLASVLSAMGLKHPRQWEHYDRYRMRSVREDFYFRNVFTHEYYHQIIVAEDISNDLGGLERVRYFLSEHEDSFRVVFVFLVSDRRDADRFLSRNAKAIKRKVNSAMQYCFLTKSEELYLNPEKQDAYFKTDPLWLPVQIEDDDYLGRLEIKERQVYDDNGELFPV